MALILWYILWPQHLHIIIIVNPRKIRIKVAYIHFWNVWGQREDTRRWGAYKRWWICIMFWEFINEAIKHLSSLCLTPYWNFCFTQKLLPRSHLPFASMGEVIKCSKTKLRFRVLALCCVRFRTRGKCFLYWFFSLWEDITHFLASFSTRPVSPLGSTSANTLISLPLFHWSYSSGIFTIFLFS